MVHLDEERRRLDIAVSNAEENLKNAKWALFCYDSCEILAKYGLKSGKAYSFGLQDNILCSNSPLERCVFDDSQISRISSIRGGSHIKDSALYRCKKCKVVYYLPLNKKDKKAHDKRMREMIIG